MKIDKNCNHKMIIILFVAIIPCAAHAQMVDYNSLQSLFGEPVTTTATGTPQRASDVPTNMAIITADEIRQSGSRNIPEILSRIPGIDILQDSINSYDVGVRGYQQPFQPRLLVLVDGRQVFLDDYSRTVWDNIPVNVDDIRQIEVVKGASSALFGSNAAGGVVNIITYSPLYDNNNVATVSVGTQHSFTGDTTVTAKGSWGGTKFSAGGMTADEFSTGRISGDQVPTFSPHYQYFVNSSVFQLTPDLQADTEITYSDSRANTIDALSDIMAAQNTTTYSAKASFSWQGPYGLITNNNYYNHSLVDFYEIPDGGAPYGLTTGMFVSQLQDQFKIGTDNTLRAALEYRHKDFVGDGAAIVPQSPDLSENDYAVSGSWLHKFSDKLSWTNALRLDHQETQEIGTLAPGVLSSYADYSHDVNAVSGNSDIVYKATDIDTLRLGYGRGVQLPSLIENGFNLIFNFDGSPSDAEGNPNLKPTIVQDWSIDYDRKITPILSTLTVSTFYEFNDDVAAPSQFLGTSQFFGAPTLASINVGDSQGWGGEIELKGSHPSGYRWDASYSYSRVADSDGVASTLNYQGSTPAHHLRLLAGYSKGSWEFDTHAQYVTSTQMFRSTSGGVSDILVSTGPYFTLSSRVGYKISDQFTLALSGTTLTQAATQENVYPAVQREALLSLTGKF